MGPVLSRPAGDREWCGRLETAASDAVVGKVLCVCAAAAIAREVLAADPVPSPQGVAALGLLAEWIDDPTGDRFDRICSTIFGDGAAPDLDPHGVTWWALRTATSSVGNFEAGWALSSTCGAAVAAGFDPEQLRDVAVREVSARQRGR